MKNERSGVYQIKCEVSSKIYIGSTVRIYTRWSEHRRLLRCGTHPSPRLQRAWIKHGEPSFTFSILEECARESLTVKEQIHIDRLRPDYNSITVIDKRYGREMQAKRAATLRARAAKITHCPRGHEYDAKNTIINQGKRVCRLCNLERVTKKFKEETDEQHQARKRKLRDYYARTKEAQQPARKAWALAHREEKREYDRKRRLRLLGGG